MVLLGSRKGTTTLSSEVNFQSSKKGRDFLDKAIGNMNPTLQCNVIKGQVWKLLSETRPSHRVRRMMN
jgi:hypothetical protein